MTWSLAETSRATRGLKACSLSSAKLVRLDLTVEENDAVFVCAS